MKQILKTISCLAMAMALAQGAMAQDAGSDKNSSATNAGTSDYDEVRDRLAHYIWFECQLKTKYYKGELSQEEVDSIYDFFYQCHGLASAQIPFRGFAPHATRLYGDGPRQSKGAVATVGGGRPLTMLSDDGQCIAFCELIVNSVRTILSEENMAEIIEREMNYELKQNVLNLSYYQPGLTTKMAAQWKKDYLREYSGKSWMKSSGATNVYVWTIPRVDNIDWNTPSLEFEDDVMPECKHFYSLAICKPGCPILSIWLAMTGKGKRHLNKYIKNITRSMKY